MRYTIAQAVTLAVEAAEHFRNEHMEDCDEPVWPLFMSHTDDIRAHLRNREDFKNIKLES